MLRCGRWRIHEYCSAVVLQEIGWAGKIGLGRIVGAAKWRAMTFTEDGLVAHWVQPLSGQFHIPKGLL